MHIEIKALTPELEEAYFDFFDNRAFSDGSPYYPCYCNAFNMSAVEIREGLYVRAKQYCGDTEGWKRALRESAVRMVREGKIRGYLAFDKGISIGWGRSNLSCVLKFLPNIAARALRHSCSNGFVRMREKKDMILWKSTPWSRRSAANWLLPDLFICMGKRVLQSSLAGEQPLL